MKNPGHFWAKINTDGFALKSAGLLRTARLLARGEVMVPGAVWGGHVRPMSPIR